MCHVSTYNDLTRAAVVFVLERWTSFTAILCEPSSSRFGLHSQTLPQFPKPIYETQANKEVSDPCATALERQFFHGPLG